MIRTIEQFDKQVAKCTKALNAKLRGETAWRWSQVCMIADVLGCSLSDLR